MITTRIIPTINPTDGPDFFTGDGVVSIECKAFVK